MTFLLISLLSLNAGDPPCARLPEMLAAAEIGLAEAPYDSAVDLAERAAGCFPESAAAHELLGRAYARGEHPGERHRAEFAYRRALGLEPERRSAWRQLAWLREKQGFHWGAKEIWKKLAEAEPADPEPLIQIGLYHERESQLTTLPSASALERERARGWYDQALERAPDHAEALWQRARIDLLGGGKEAATEGLKTLLARHPEHRPGRLLQAYLLAATRQDSLAWQNFGEALGPVGQDELDDPRPFLDYAGERCDPDTLRRFWTVRDPLWMTLRNERLLEHRRRQVWLQHLAPPGLERGVPREAVLRFGEPDAIERRIDFDAKQVAPGEQVLTLLFPGLRLGFTGVSAGGLQMPDSRSAMAFAQAVATHGEFFEPPRSSQRVSLPLTMWAFRGASPERLHVIAATTPPTRENRRLRLRQPICRRGFFFLDAIGDWVLRDLRPVDCRRRNLAAQGAAFQTRVELENQCYLAGVEFLPEPGDWLGSRRLVYRPPELWGPELNLSDILIGRCDDDSLLASDFAAHLPTGLSALPASFRPAADGRFHAGEQIALYFEIYGLIHNELGQIQYEMSLVFAAEQPGGWKGFWRRLPLASGGGGASVALREERSGIHSEEARFFLLRLDPDRLGDRELSIVVKDLIADREVRRPVALQIQGGEE